MCHSPDYEILPHSLPAVCVYHPGHDHNAMIHCLPLLKYRGVGAETIQRDNCENSLILNTILTTTLKQNDS